MVWQVSTGLSAGAGFGGIGGEALAGEPDFGGVDGVVVVSVEAGVIRPGYGASGYLAHAYLAFVFIYVKQYDGPYGRIVLDDIVLMESAAGHAPAILALGGRGWRGLGFSIFDAAIDGGYRRQQFYDDYLVCRCQIGRVAICLAAAFALGRDGRLLWAIAVGVSSGRDWESFHGSTPALLAV